MQLALDALLALSIMTVFGIFPPDIVTPLALSGVYIRVAARASQTCRQQPYLIGIFVRGLLRKIMARFLGSYRSGHETSIAHA